MKGRVHAEASSERARRPTSPGHPPCSSSSTATSSVPHRSARSRRHCPQPRGATTQRRALCGAGSARSCAQRSHPVERLGTSCDFPVTFVGSLDATPDAAYCASRRSERTAEHPIGRRGAGAGPASKDRSELFGAATGPTPRPPLYPARTVPQTVAAATQVGTAEHLQGPLSRSEAPVLPQGRRRGFVLFRDPLLRSFKQVAPTPPTARLRRPGPPPRRNPPPPPPGGPHLVPPRTGAPLSQHRPRARRRARRSRSPAPGT